MMDIMVLSPIGQQIQISKRTGTKWATPTKGPTVTYWNFSNDSLLVVSRLCIGSQMMRTGGKW